MPGLLGRAAWYSASTCPGILGHRGAAQRLAHGGKAPHRRQPGGNQHEREHDDQEALDEVGVGRGHQAAKVAVEEEGHGHGRHHAVGRDDVAAGGHGDDLARPLEHRSLG